MKITITKDAKTGEIEVKAKGGSGSDYLSVLITATDKMTQDIMDINLLTFLKAFDTFKKDQTGILDKLAKILKED